MSTKVLIVGGGFAGCNAAHMLSMKKPNYKIEIIETGKILGGGVRTYWHGGHPFTYGPRHFLTEVEKTYEFISKYIPMKVMSADHENLTYVEGDKQFYTYPPHIDDIDKMPDKDQIRKELSQKRDINSLKTFKDHYIYACGETMYKKFCEKYSHKMWDIKNNHELDGEEFGPGDQPSKWDNEYNRICKIKLRSGNRAAWDVGKVISSFPTAPDGYNGYFDLAVKSDNIKVRLNTFIQKFDIQNYKVQVNGEWEKYDIIINTASPEILCNKELGELRWRGRDFEFMVLPVEYAFPKNVIFMYYANNEKFTRVVEYKKFYEYKSDQTLLVKEIPSFSNKLYPYPAMKDQLIAKKYYEACPENVFHSGRAGLYRYIDMDDIILNHMNLLETL
tara:strand:- start:1512 stop:2678 length:1167 start_codon:yes stop_codon:yes gene_type:complete